jgi:RNA polymerase sigma factor (sigma-70 family)
METAMKRALRRPSCPTQRPTAPDQAARIPTADAGLKAMDVIELVARARDGERRALSTLLERYLPLTRAVARGYRLNDADIEDVGQTVCLRLIEHLDRIREAGALPAWVNTTARHESLRLARSHRRTIPVDPLNEAKRDTITDDHNDLDANLLRAEQARALRDGLAHLPQRQRDLLLLLMDDQPRSYREIGQLLAMPIGSIGPTRARGVARLRVRCVRVNEPVGR